ncbi:MAG: hypothetical protein ACT4O1_02220 [Gemmatimonadota bacterium]
MKGIVLCSLLICGAACGSATDAGSDAHDVRGVWSYTAVQASPALNVRGSLRIDQQSGADFSGTAEFRETDVQGTMRDRSGQLSGRVVGGSAVDFDVFIDDAPRRHVASLQADSMLGTWARTGVTPPQTGSFSARRLQ